MCDSKGVIRSDRTDLNPQKRRFATDRDLHTLSEALAGADVFAGFSKAGVLSKEMIRGMAEKPIIMALANPYPEISYEDAQEARPDALIATGRSDYPNQVNNVIGFLPLYLQRSTRYPCKNHQRPDENRRGKGHCGPCQRACS